MIPALGFLCGVNMSKTNASPMENNIIVSITRQSPDLDNDISTYDLKVKIRLPNN